MTILGLSSNLSKNIYMYVFISVNLCNIALILLKYVCQYTCWWRFLGGWDRKESACNAGDPGSVPWRMEWQPTPAFLRGEVHRQRSLAGSSPWGHKESDTTEWLTVSNFSFTCWYLSLTYFWAKISQDSVRCHVQSILNLCFLPLYIFLFTNL